MAADRQGIDFRSSVWMLLEESGSEMFAEIGVGLGDDRRGVMALVKERVVRDLSSTVLLRGGQHFC
ncbi:MAG: hypothetical protein ACTIDO_03175 [Brevibacterium aurantiacum]|uniref:hypothetical protein n=1 Tax=Brevibacterium aurantiacum TaxID=273384 RepID=UPI003F8FFE8C